MLNFIEDILKDLGFSKITGKWVNYDLGISVFLKDPTSQIISDRMMINLDCNITEILNILFQVIDDPWEYEKHLLEDSFNKIKWIHEHYGKIFESYGFMKEPSIIKSYSSTDTGLQKNINIVLEYGITNRGLSAICFKYKPGPETFTLWTGLEGEDLDILNLGNNDKEAVKQILLHIPSYSYIVDNKYKDLYVKLEKVQRFIGDTRESTINKNIFKEIPETWMNYVRGSIAWRGLIVV